MLMAVKNHIKLIFVTLKYNVLKEMDTKASFITSIISMIINNGIMVFQWIILFSLKDNIGGYGIKEVLILWAMAAGTYGFSSILFSGANNLSDQINAGSLDYYFTKPKNTLLFSILGFSPSAVGDLIYAYILLILIKLSIWKILLFTLLMIVAAIIRTAYKVFLHSLAFYMKKSDGFASNMLMAELMLETYPEGIFQGMVRYLFYTFLPVGFIIYIPVSIIVNISIMSIVYLLLFMCFMVSIAYILFYLGIKKYSSSSLSEVNI